MNWYRVELDKDGTVVSCAQCEAPSRPGYRVFYTWEASEDAATRKAVARYQAYLTKQREDQRTRRARNKQAGKCQCGRAPKPGQEQCQVCLDSAEDSRLRAQDRVTGTAYAPPKTPRPELLAKRKEQHDNSTRLEILEEVQRAWCHCKTEREFTAWLQAQLKQLRRAAA